MSIFLYRKIEDFVYKKSPSCLWMCVFAQQNFIQGEAFFIIGESTNKIGKKVDITAIYINNSNNN